MSGSNGSLTLPFLAYAYLRISAIFTYSNNVVKAWKYRDYL